MGNGGPRASCKLPASFRRRDLEFSAFGMGYPSYVEPTPLSEQESLRVNQLNTQTAANCGDDERGHKAMKGNTVLEGLKAHMAYNQDGYYVAAASCYIAKMFKSAGGAAPAVADVSA